MHFVYDMKAKTEKINNSIGHSSSNRSQFDNHNLRIGIYWGFRLQSCEAENFDVSSGLTSILILQCFP